MSEIQCKCIILIIEEVEGHKPGTLLHISQEKAQELVAARLATDDPATVSEELSRVDFSDPNQDKFKEYA